MPVDLAVLGQDPRFGGGGHVQTQAFLAAAREAGRAPVLLFDEHPGLGRPRVTWRRVEGLRQLAAARRLATDARGARSLWVAATLAQHGAAAPRTGRRYGCWVGTTIRSEWRGRAPGLPPGRRAAAAASLAVLERLERRVLAGAAALYATSAASRREVAAASGRGEEEVGLIPIPVDTGRFSPAPDEEWEALLDAPVVTFVGRASDPRKNVRLLLEAFELLRRARPRARLRLVGDPPPGPVPAGVELAGPEADVAAELRRAAVFALPSRQEGFGIAVAEALAAGLPAVVTPCGGPEELVRASGGGRVLAGFGAGELAEALAELAADPATARSMRAGGREHVARVHGHARFAGLVRDALGALDGD